MSGRPKGPVPSEAEQLREATRAAHEAAKDLRAALRETREESARLQRDHAEMLAEILSAAAAAAENRIGDAVNLAMKHSQTQIDAVMDFLDKILGTADAGGLGKVIVNDAAAKIAAQLSAEVILPKGSAVQLKRKADAGQVFVTTDPALAPPGSVVIDGR